MARKNTDTVPSASPADLGLASPSLHGKGHLVDPADPRDFSARAMFGAPRALPSESTQLVNSLRRIVDQGSLSSCVGMALGTVIDTRLRFLGTNPQEPSRIGLYTIARAMYRLNPDDPLVDTGSYPRMAMKGIREYGVPLEAAWKFDPAKVNAELPVDVLMGASAAHLSAWYRVDSTESARIQDMCNALSKGYPLTMAIQVDQAFEDYGPSSADLGVMQGKSLGGHALAVLGYRTNPGGLKSFLVANSWGTSWGRSGLIWISETRIAQASTTDIYALQVA